MFADLENQVAADARSQLRGVIPRWPSALLRIPLPKPMNAVDLAEVKFDNGMITTAAMNASLTGRGGVHGPAVK
jgi:hypothetical protein